MDWVSFFFGFLAFPVLGASVLGLMFLARRFQGGTAGLTDVAAHRDSTLSFSPRLIGEIGEGAESDSGPTAKAS